MCERPKRAVARYPLTASTSRSHNLVGRLVRVLLDRQVDLKQEFIERQIRRNADRFPDEIYDVTAWSLPLAFGVDCSATAAVGPGAQRSVGRGSLGRASGRRAGRRSLT